MKTATEGIINSAIEAGYDVNNSRGWVRFLKGDSLVGFALPEKSYAEVLGDHDDLRGNLQGLGLEVRELKKGC